MDDVGRWVDGNFEFHDRILSRQGASPSSTTNNSSPPKFSLNGQSRREKFMKQHLVFLLHAHKCSERDRVRMQEEETLIPVS